jgi:hypothetical protein
LFHERRVLPLMQRARRLDEMVPNMPLEGTMLMIGGLIGRRSRGTSSRRSGVSPDAILDAHPPMRPDDDFVKMVSALHSSSPRPFP